LLTRTPMVFFKDEEHQESQSDGPCSHCCHTDELRYQLGGPTAIEKAIGGAEQAYGEGSHGSVQTMHRDGSHRDRPPSVS
jgi:hypothetical protein